jgi:hypothetical protein
MRHMRKRVDGLESKLRPPKLHIVCCYGDQSREDALDQYGRERIGNDDDLIVVIRKPGRTPCN